MTTGTKTETIRVETANVIAEVIAERNRQDEQWGGPEHDDAHNMTDWYQFLCSHNDRAYAGGKKIENYDRRVELIKVAALAIAAVESHDRKALKRTQR